MVKLASVSKCRNRFRVLTAKLYQKPADLQNQTGFLQEGFQKRFAAIKTQNNF